MKEKENTINDNSSVATPRTKVARLIGKEKVSRAVRRKLLFGEVISDQLRDSFITLGKSHSRKQMYYTSITSPGYNCDSYRTSTQSPT